MALIFQALEPSYALAGTGPKYKIQFLDPNSGLPSDPSSIESLEVLDPAGSVLRTFIPPTITNPSVGNYEVQDIVVDDPVVLQLRWTWIEDAVVRKAITAFEVVSTASNTTETQIKNQVLAQLGVGVVNVSLPAGTLDFALMNARRWYSMWHGQPRRVELTLVPGQNEYDVADDCYYVYDVAFRSDVTRVADALGSFGIYGFAQLRMSSIPIEDLFGPGGANGFYSSLVQSLQYSEMGRRILSSQPSWEWFPNPVRKLWVFPMPNDSIPISVDYVSHDLDMTFLEPHEYHFIQQYTLAEAKEALGRIRGKFSDYAMAQGSKSMDASELLSESIEMKLNLNEKLSAYAPPGWILFS